MAGTIYEYICKVRRASPGKMHFSQFNVSFFLISRKNSKTVVVVPSGRFYLISG